MDARTITMRRGLRMAMQVAALSTAAGALGAAATASEAQADVGSAAVGAGGLDGIAGPSESMQVKGWSCWGAPISRGPAAPPQQGDADFEALLAEVPS